MPLFSSKREAEPKIISGKTLKCSHCDHNRFFSKRVQLNTTLFSFFNLDAFNKNANCYICEACRHIHWFDD
jgi:hypothetical protein